MRGALVIGVAGLLAGCAGGGMLPSRSLSGASGSIAWEVRDVARNAAKGGWDYTIVFTERAGVPIQFHRQEVGAFAGNAAIRPPANGPLSRSLGRHEKLRLPLWSAGPDAGEASLVEEYQTARKRIVEGL